MIGITERGDAALDLRWHDWVLGGNPTILITKDPMKLSTYLHGQENIIIHCTITGFGGTVVEPNVPDVHKSIQGMNILINRFGVNRVVLRIDPIIPTEKGVVRAQEVFACKTGGQRVRISFLDMYNHVRERFDSKALTIPYAGMHAPLGTRNTIAAFFEGAEICGEPGMRCAGCVSQLDCDTFGIKPTTARAGQRGACECIALKKELLSTRAPCAHKCLYCYWQD